MGGVYEEQQMPSLKRKGFLEAQRLRWMKRQCDGTPCEHPEPLIGPVNYAPSHPAR